MTTSRKFPEVFGLPGRFFKNSYPAPQGSREELKLEIGVNIWRFAGKCKQQIKRQIISTKTSRKNDAEHEWSNQAKTTRRSHGASANLSQLSPHHFLIDSLTSSRFFASPLLRALRLASSQPRSLLTSAPSRLPFFPPRAFGSIPPALLRPSPTPAPPPPLPRPRLHLPQPTHP